MAGVNIQYKGNSIALIQGTGYKTLKAGGKYCEGDIKEPSDFAFRNK